MTSLNRQERSPVHVVYGGAHLFRSGTATKLCKIALASLQEYAPTASELASAMGFSGPRQLLETVYERTRIKLDIEPVEDFRIDFEDGYGVRPDSEEDEHAAAAAQELAHSFAERANSPFTGIRIKSFAPAT